MQAQTHARCPGPEAARMAGFAPSIHNTQPWLWRVRRVIAASCARNAIVNWP